VNVTSINNASQVVGYATFATNGVINSQQAVVWNNGVPTVLPSPSGARYTLANHINDAGEVVGSGNNLPLVWNGQTLTILGVSTYKGGIAYSNNSAGLIVGTLASRAAVWHGTTPTLLANLGPNTISGGYAVNNSGVVVGQATTDGKKNAAGWANGKIFVLSTTDKSTANAINSVGAIVGTAKAVTGENHGALWGNVAKTTEDLNTLISPTDAGMYVITNALAINDSCTIIVEAVGKGVGSDTYYAFILKLNDPSKCVKNGL